MLIRAFAATAGVAIACCAFVAPGVRAGAAPASNCAPSGVTVIVDFGYFGGDIERGCDPGVPANALEAVRTAGFATAGTARYGDAFVCRIDGRPSSRKEACTDTPPASSSWSFYYARPTDRGWTYSARGVLSYQPPSGSLIAFAFGDEAKPGVLPSGARIATTTTTTAPRRSTAPPTGPPVAPQGASTATAAPEPVVGPPTSASTMPTNTTRPKQPSTTTSRPDGSTTTSSPRVVDKTASAPIDDGAGSGSPLPAIVTIVLVAGLGAGAFAVVRIRMRRAT